MEQSPQEQQLQKLQSNPPQEQSQSPVLTSPSLQLKKEEDLKSNGILSNPRAKKITVGQKNVLFAELIDKVIISGGGSADCVPVIKEYYENLGFTVPTTRMMYDIARQAKSLWLTNFSLPNLEEYKKDRMNSSELMVSEIKRDSEKDVTDKVKVILDVYKYTDGIIGLDKSNGIDVFIGINTDSAKVLNALEMPDDSFTISED